MNNYFYVDVDDEITSVIGRLRKEPSEEIFLVVPKRAIIAQSLVNLRLLSKEASKLNKKLIFVSPDSQTRKIAEKAGLSVKKYVAKPKEETQAEVENLIPSKKRTLEHWEEEAAKEELKKVIGKPKSAGPTTGRVPTRIKAGVYSTPKIAPPVPLTTPPVPASPIKPIPITERKIKQIPVEAEAKPQVVNLKEVAAQRRMKNPPVMVRPPKNVSTQIDARRDRGTELVEEPPLRELLTPGAEETPQREEAQPIISQTRKPQISRANPFKVKKIEKIKPQLPSPVSPPPPPPPPSPPSPISLQEKQAVPAPAAPVPAVPVEIPDQLERETANLTLREKERLRDLWMEQKGIVRGKSFQENTKLDLKAEESPKEELVTQGTGLFQTTHRRVVGSGKVIDLRTVKGNLGGSADLSTRKVPQRKGKEIILPLLNVKLLIFFVIGITVILVILMGIILPEANISIKPKSSSDNLALKIWASGEVSQTDFGQETIPAKAAHFKVNEEKTFSATTDKTINENPQGQVTVYNSSSQPLSLKQDAKLTDSSGNKFYTSAPITVPASKQGNTNGNSNGNTNTAGASTAGSGVVGIMAENSGKDYNLKIGDALSIPGLADGDYAGLVTVEIAQEMKKGESRTVKTVSQEDLDNAKNELVNQAKQNSADQIKNNFDAETAKKIRPEDLVTEDITFTADKKVGQEADSFTAQVAVSFFALAFSQSDLQDLAKKLVESDRDNKNGTAKINNYSLSDPRPLENKSEISANVDYQITDKVDPGEIKKAVLAKKKSEAEEYLKGRSDIEQYSLNIWPNILGHMPVLERRIKVEIQ
jgi:hypothetical protein